MVRPFQIGRSEPPREERAILAKYIPTDSDIELPRRRGVDLDQAREVNSTLVAKLATTFDGRETLISADSDTAAFVKAIEGSINDLAERMKSSTESRRLAATLGAAVILERCQSIVGTIHYLPVTWPYRKCQRFHAVLDRIMRRYQLGNRRSWLNFAPKIWGLGGMVLTLLAAVLVLSSAIVVRNSTTADQDLIWATRLSVSGALTVALILMITRVIVTCWVWALSAYPLDDSPDHAVLDSSPAMCSLGHGTDLALFGAIGIYLEGAGARAAGGALAGLVIIVILATIFRLANKLTPRLHVERIARGIAALVGLATIASASSPVLVVGAFVVPVIFGGVEAFEAHKAKRMRRSGFADETPGPVKPVLPTSALATAGRKMLV